MFIYLLLLASEHLEISHPAYWPFKCMFFVGLAVLRELIQIYFVLCGSLG